ncbi:hypothetical protein [Corynebacterium sp. A21]|uniref:hypothetical protein n=1 Tax=Corynebacterium sp. A21 TaxID=3457318 RepID=UPI003FD635D4
MKTEWEWHDGIPWPRRVSEPGDWGYVPNHESPKGSMLSSEHQNTVDELAARELSRTTAMTLDGARGYIHWMKQLSERFIPNVQTHGDYVVMKHVDECGRPTGRFKIENA